MKELMSWSRKTMINKSKRDFLASCSVAASGLILPTGFAWASSDDQDFWNLPRQLRLYRPDINEAVSEVYWADGKVVEAGYLRICQLLRDIHVNESVYMDIRLLDLCRAVQGYMEFYGFKRPLIINSGYRSAKTNARTEGAAKNSMHISGRALDFSMPDVPSNYMGSLASHYQGGGVGFYPGNGFTHMDTGSVRYWVGGSSSLKGLHGWK